MLQRAVSNPIAHYCLDHNRTIEHYWPSLYRCKRAPPIEKGRTGMCKPITPFRHLYPTTPLLIIESSSSGQLSSTHYHENTIDKGTHTLLIIVSSSSRKVSSTHYHVETIDQDTCTQAPPSKSLHLLDQLLSSPYMNITDQGNLWCRRRPCQRSVGCQRCDSGHSVGARRVASSPCVGPSPENVF